MSAEPGSNADPLIGQKLGDYVVEAKIAQGGMGFVYRAMQPLIRRPVAIKVLRPEWASNPEQATRFLNEAQALSAIKHESIIDIISFGHLPDGRQYMVMEYLEGAPLEHVLARLGRLEVSEALWLSEAVLGALEAAHSVGVLHRDLKPSNVFIARQTNGGLAVKLLDFGLAKVSLLETTSRPFPKASMVGGTPEYLSPEQARGLVASPRSDLYAFGVMLFEMLSGRLPFRRETVTATMEAQVREAPPSLAALLPTLPERATQLVTQLLEKEEARRPASALEARQALPEIAEVPARPSQRIRNAVDGVAGIRTLSPVFHTLDRGTKAALRWARPKTPWLIPAAVAAGVAVAWVLAKLPASSPAPDPVAAVAPGAGRASLPAAPVAVAPAVALAPPTLPQAASPTEPEVGALETTPLRVAASAGSTGAPNAASAEAIEIPARCRDVGRWQEGLSKEFGALEQALLRGPNGESRAARAALSRIRQTSLSVRTVEACAAATGQIQAWSAQWLGARGRR